MPSEMPSTQTTPIFVLRLNQKKKRRCACLQLYINNFTSSNHVLSKCLHIYISQNRSSLRYIFAIKRRNNRSSLNSTTYPTLLFESPSLLYFSIRTNQRINQITFIYLSWWISPIIVHPTTTNNNSAHRDSNYINQRSCESNKSRN